MPTFIRLVDYATAEEKEKALLRGDNRYRADQRDFEKIPGSPIAYWTSKKFLDIFSDFKIINSKMHIKQGLATADNARFVRIWYEVPKGQLTIKWFPYNKGGDFHKWYGNQENIVNWNNNGYEIKNYYDEKGKLKSRPQNTQFYFKKNISWSKVSSGNLALRYYQDGFIFDVAGCSIFGDSENIIFALGSINSKAVRNILEFISPTLNFEVGHIASLPIFPNHDAVQNNINFSIIKNCISLSKSDWDLRETSWDFRRSPLLTDYGAPKIETVIDENLTDWSWPSAFAAGKALHLQSQAEAFKRHWTALFLELHKNEEENNRIFIDLYGLRDELTPEVPYSEITILQEELSDSARRENRVEFDDAVLARQFVSYGVGCLMGRYSAEQDGLILADAGATLNDFLAKVPSAQWLPDDDGILPLTDEDDFPDDLPTRFKAWLRFISGSHYEANLRWLEERLGKDLRTWFLRDFYKDHLRRYKNRPIYWMISSPTGVFRALIYLHRYTKDTVGKVLNDYLRPYRTKIEQKLRSLAAIIDSALSTQTEKTKARKRYAQLEKYLSEIDLWEKKHVYPLALQRIELDLDDGVKVNYRKLSSILEPVKQLEAKEEE